MGIFIKILVNILLSSPVWTATIAVIWSWKRQLWKKLQLVYNQEQHDQEHTDAMLSCLRWFPWTFYELFVFQACGFCKPESQKITSDLCNFKTAPTAQFFRNNRHIYSQEHTSGARCPVMKLHIQNYRVSHRFTIQTPEAVTWICRSLY